MRMGGRTTIITGGASGIGAACARLFVAEGGNVVIADLAEAGRDLAAELGGAARFVSIDVTEEADWSAAFRQAATWFGRVDALVNSAGLWEGGPLVDAPVESFERQVAVNLKGVFLGCREAVRHMRDRPRDLPWASIVNVASTAGLIGTKDNGIYTLTKGGVRLFSKAVAVEAAEYDYPIRCNSLHPGSTETPMLARIREQKGVPSAAALKARNLIGRAAQAEEIALAALFLASAESSFTTGTELIADGGYSAR